MKAINHAGILIAEIDTVAKAFSFAKQMVNCDDLAMVKQQLRISNQAAGRLNAFIEQNYDPKPIIEPQDLH